MDDPLPSPRYNVGLTYNLKKGIYSAVEDIEAEYDSIDTVNAIKDALQSLGCKVLLLEADTGLPEILKKTRPDIVFNIAEGLHGRGREAHVPALLNFLRIPFTGSDETTLSIALDKALTKRLLSTYRIKTPRYQIVCDSSEKIKTSFKFPIIVKPNAEGSSKGISDTAVVTSTEELRGILRKNFTVYGQLMLVEEFIEGREFTVAIAGNGDDIVVFPPMEVIFRNKKQKHSIYSYNVKKDFKKHIEYQCPALLDSDAEARMKAIARRIYSVLHCRDFSRIDFRMSTQGDIYFIEINPLPGLAPDYSDYILIAGFCGLDYTSVIKTVLNSALKRYGMETFR